MRDANGRYTVNEIVKATGMQKSTVVYRIKKLGLRRTAEGYAYEDVKRVVDYQPLRGRNSQDSRAAQLRRKLTDDGKL